MRFKTYFKDLIDPGIIAGILVILAVSIILTVFFSSKVESFKQKYRTKFIAYLIGLFLGVALITFIGSSEIFDNQIFSIFSFYQAVFFILGMIHCYIYRSYFDKFDKNSPWIEMLFSLVTFMYILIPIIIVYTIVKGNLYAYDMAFSSIMFMVPTLIYLTFDASISIPPKIYKTWMFPKEDAYPDPPDNEYRDMVVVTFVFHKDPDSDVRTEFRAKAPIRMDFGRLFFHFVNDYNIRNPDSKINLIDKSGERQHWVFYLKSRYFGILKFIKPKNPLYANAIGENSIIICQRTPPLSSKDEIEHQSDENQKGEKENIKEQNNDNF
jgi:hypothetical protein